MLKNLIRKIMQTDKSSAKAFALETCAGAMLAITAYSYTNYSYAQDRNNPRNYSLLMISLGSAICGILFLYYASVINTPDMRHVQDKETNEHNLLESQNKERDSGAEVHKDTDQQEEGGPDHIFAVNNRVPAHNTTQLSINDLTL